MFRASPKTWWKLILILKVIGKIEWQTLSQERLLRLQPRGPSPQRRRAPEETGRLELRKIELRA